MKSPDKKKIQKQVYHTFRHRQSQKDLHFTDDLQLQYADRRDQSERGCDHDADRVLPGQPDHFW